MRVGQYGDGQCVVQQGDEPDYLYIIIEGQLRSLRRNEDGDEVTLRLLGHPESCMGATIFMGGGAPVTIESIGSSRLAQIPSKFVKNLVLKDSRLAQNMLELAARHFHQAINQIEMITIKTPVQRIGSYLLHQHIKQRSRDMSFTLKFRKGVIANHLGMTPETLSRALQKIKDMGIGIDGQTIRLSDAYALCHFCDLETSQNCRFAKEGDCPHCHF
jgi:CRP-like cAMP-binding protein